MGESVLVVLVNQTKVKILHTKKFQPGDFTAMNTSDDSIRQNIALKEIIETTKYAEFEAWHQVSGYDLVFLKVLKSVIFNNVVHKHRRNLIYLCQDQIVKAKIFTWREYIAKIKKEEEFN